MTFSMPVLIFVGGLWLIVLLGCIVFALLGISFKRKLVKAREENKSLYAEIQEISANPIDQTEAGQVNLDAERATLQARITELEEKLSAQRVKGEINENDNQVDVLNQTIDELREEKNMFDARIKDLELAVTQAQEQVAGQAEEAVRLQQKLAVLTQEKSELERRLAGITDTLDAATDTSTMREMIVNFTEESRELLQNIDQLTREKAELQQTIQDMEVGGKGTAGAVVGLKRRLAEAEESLSHYQDRYGKLEA